MGEKGFDPGFPHVAGMAFAMKRNELLSPADLGPLRADAVMPEADCIAGLAEKFGLASLRGVHRAPIILENIHRGVIVNVTSAF
jgi:hypothetical protein